MVFVGAFNGPIVDGPFTVNDDIFLWTARLAAGSQVNLMVIDAVGHTSNSASFTIASSGTFTRSL
ncbi:hypothetical protein C8Q70DRAFT_1056361 [Cubamyces menziesii]|nr:hypothetical protein C8Q70DRAFT_1056361 [Cubamyces menziesii]